VNRLIGSEAYSSGSSEDQSVIVACSSINPMQDSPKPINSLSSDPVLTNIASSMQPQGQQTTKEIVLKEPEPHLFLLPEIGTVDFHEMRVHFANHIHSNKIHRVGKKVVEHFTKSVAMPHKVEAHKRWASAVSEPCYT
jgi:hypothetical protein